eukprot:3938617-Rhodomonas_salina.1
MGVQETDRLDAVRVNLHLVSLGQLRARYVLLDPQAAQLGAARSRAHDDVRVSDVLQIRLGHQAVAEDVDAARYNRNGSEQRGLCLEGVSALVARVLKARARPR